MADHSIVPPPPALLHRKAEGPQSTTIVAELRTDASLEFDPKDAPAYLKIADSRFGALIIWRADLSWSDAQQVQAWLRGAPAEGGFQTREEALKDFYETMLDADGDVFVEYIGTYLTTDQSHAAYTTLIGMRKPRSREDYQTAFLSTLDALKPVAGVGGWYGELIAFMKLLLNQPTSREEFLTLAGNVGDLAQDKGGQAVYPLIRLLVT